jgi:(p)ppGpp synthase/HD superfamily hydrolase
MSKATLQFVLQEIYDHHDIFCNQKYDKEYPYSLHLKSVVSTAKKFISLLPDTEHIDVLIASAGHDLIEDGRLTYNDVRVKYGDVVAEIVYCCTDERGRNRRERHSGKHYDDLRQNRLAVYVKLCDTYSNIVYSLLTNSRMFNMYKNEFKELRDELYFENEYDDLWNEIEKVLNIIN